MTHNSQSDRPVPNCISIHLLAVLSYLSSRWHRSASQPPYETYQALCSFHCFAFAGSVHSCSRCTPPSTQFKYHHRSAPPFWSRAQKLSAACCGVISFSSLLDPLVTQETPFHLQSLSFSLHEENPPFHPLGIRVRLICICTT